MGTSDLVESLKRVFGDWEALLGGLGERQIMAQPAVGKMSIGETITHLMAWQQLSMARVDAALLGTEPQLPAWLGGADPFHADDHADEFNARIRELWHGQAWSSRHQEWRELFQRFLQKAAAVPESMMTDAARYPWLRGSALSAVLEGSLEHHQEHLDRVRARQAGVGRQGAARDGAS